MSISWKNYSKDFAKLITTINSKGFSHTKNPISTRDDKLLFFIIELDHVKFLAGISFWSTFQSTTTYHIDFYDIENPFVSETGYLSHFVSVGFRFNLKDHDKIRDFVISQAKSHLTYYREKHIITSLNNQINQLNLF